MASLKTKKKKKKKGTPSKDTNTKKATKKKKKKHLVKLKEKPDLDAGLFGNLNNHAKQPVINGPPKKYLRAPEWNPKTAEIYKSYPKWGEKFFESYRIHKVQNTACTAINIHPNTLRRYKRGCKEFRSACDDIYNELTDTLERSALSRAVHGVDEVCLHEGQPIWITDPITKEKGFLTKKKYETSLTIFMLKGRRREIYYPENQNLGGTADDKAAAVREAIAEIAKVMAPEPLE